MAKETTTLYVIGGAVALVIAALVFFRPKAAYAQPGAPAPGLPGPGVPPAQEYDVYLPMGSYITPAEPVSWEGGIRHVRYVRNRTEEQSEAETGYRMYNWQAIDQNGQLGIWFSLPQIAITEDVSVVFGPNGEPVWTPARGDLRDFR